MTPSWGSSSWSSDPLTSARSVLGWIRQYGSTPQCPVLESPGRIRRREKQFQTLKGYMELVFSYQQRQSSYGVDMYLDFYINYQMAATAGFSLLLILLGSLRGEICFSARLTPLQTRSKCYSNMPGLTTQIWDLVKKATIFKWYLKNLQEEVRGRI